MCAYAILLCGERDLRSAYYATRQRDHVQISGHCIALISDCAEAQADLELHCPHMTFYPLVKGLTKRTNVTEDIINYDMVIKKVPSVLY